MTTPKKSHTQPEPIVQTTTEASDLSGVVEVLVDVPSLPKPHPQFGDTVKVKNKLPHRITKGKDEPVLPPETATEVILDHWLLSQINANYVELLP